MTFDLDPIIKRRDAATNGPWAVPAANVFRVVAPGEPHTNRPQGMTPPYQYRIVADMGEADGSAADAEFIAHARTDVDGLIAEVQRLQRAAIDLAKRLTENEAERQRLQAIVDQPDPRDFMEAAVTEARYQQVRWGSPMQPGTTHDSHKSDADWFWLIGYLSGKALHRPGDDSTEKLLHRITTIAAAAANWHAAVLAREAVSADS